jgi:hypothetical protein
MPVTVMTCIFFLGAASIFMTGTVVAVAISACLKKSRLVYRLARGW